MAKQKKKVGKVFMMIDDVPSEIYADPEAAAKAASAICHKDITAKSVCYCCDHGTKKYQFTFRWDDPAIAISRRASRSRHKGNTFETEIADKLRKIGYAGCKTSRAESRLADANHIDIVDTEDKLPVNIQCKYQSNTPSFYTIREGCRSDRPFCIIWKKTGEAGKNSPGTIAMVDIDFFYYLLKIYHINLLNNVDKDYNAKPRAH